MPSLKSLRTRIKSVKNTQQITKTMKMVAAAKVRRARSAVEAARPYADALGAMLAGLVGAESGGPVLLSGREKVKTVRLIVVGSDRGLCGSLNAALLKAAAKWVETQQAMGRMVQLVAVGRKIRDGLRQSHGNLVIERYTDLGRTVDFSLAQTIGTKAREAFESGEADEVHTLYSACVSMLTQQPTAQQIIPFTRPQAQADAVHSAPDYEPSEEAVLSHILPLNLNMQVFKAMLESAASEHAARMTAMDSATRNAGQMIKKLSIQYNRSRQATITKELIEIISGAEAI